MNPRSNWALYGAGMVLVASFALTGSVYAQTKEEVDKLAADWGAAANKGDAKAIAALYTEDTVRFNEDGGNVIGRAALEAMWAPYFAGQGKGSKFTVKIGSIHPVGAGVAVIEGTYEQSSAQGDKVSGTWVNTIVKKGRAWLIASNAIYSQPSTPPKR